MAAAIIPDMLRCVFVFVDSLHVFVQSCNPLMHVLGYLFRSLKGHVLSPALAWLKRPLFKQSIAKHKNIA